tara:strand:- start:163 stop:522 length:360 start_codon:yes stop_codon:yes gene_type:complete
MKLTKKYLEKLIKEECAAMLPLAGGEEEMTMGGGEGPPGATDLPDDPDAAFGVGYTAALEEVLAAIEGLMPNTGGEGEEGAEVIAISGDMGDIDAEEEMEESMGSTMYKRDEPKSRRRK